MIDPNIPIIPMQPTVTNVPYGNNIYFATIFTTKDEENDYLSNLDSDTRDYVLKHTDEFRSKADIIDCVNRLHGTS